MRMSLNKMTRGGNDESRMRGAHSHSWGPSWTNSPHAVSSQHAKSMIWLKLKPDKCPFSDGSIRELREKYINLGQFETSMR